MAKVSFTPIDLEDCEWREFDDGKTSSAALFCDNMKYRYRLRREWGTGKVLCFAMLNPSTASELKNDPTIERCERRARIWGYSAFEVVNLFALRCTDPKGLYKAEEPVGKSNDEAILKAVDQSDDLLIAWGAHGALYNRSSELRSLLKGHRAFHLGLTKSGEPRHPLYISYDKDLESIDL